MRKLMAMFAICVVATSTQLWALAGMGDIKFDGSLEVNGASANNERDLGGITATVTPTGNDHRGVTDTRVRLGMSATVTENVTGRVEVVRSPNSAANQALYGGTGTNASPTVHDELSSFEFSNAYVDIKDIWGMDAMLGRQYQGDPGDIVW